MSAQPHNQIVRSTGNQQKQTVPISYRLDGLPDNQTRMWANAQRDGRPAEHRWRPLFNSAKFGWRRY